MPPVVAPSPGRGVLSPDWPRSRRSRCFCTYSVQEWLEGVFAVGHPAGLEGVFGHGGYWAVPLSLLAGLVVAALLRFASAAVEVVARLAARRPLPGPAFAALRPTAFSAVLSSPLARRSAGRAPPELCSF